MQPLPLPLPLPMPPLLLSQRHQPHVDPLCRLALQLQPQQRHVTSVVGGRRQRVVVLLLLGDAYSCLLLLLLDASALVVRVRRGPHTQVHAGDCACGHAAGLHRHSHLGTLTKRTGYSYHPMSYMWDGPTRKTLRTANPIGPYQTVGALYLVPIRFSRTCDCPPPAAELSTASTPYTGCCCGPLGWKHHGTSLGKPSLTWAACGWLPAGAAFSPAAASAATGAQQHPRDSHSSCPMPK